jgi:hypothetical protein
MAFFDGLLGFIDVAGRDGLAGLLDGALHDTVGTTLLRSVFLAVTRMYF